MSLRDSSDGRIPAIRLLHLILIVSMTLAFVAGAIAFDFDMKMSIGLRDILFNIHRLAGLSCLGMALVWICLWLAAHAKSGLKAGKVTFLGVYHSALLILAALVPLLPWIGRALEGRWEELYVFISPYNLVSHPTSDLTYWLLDKHKRLVELLAYLLLGHVAGALFHALILKDGVWRGMFSRSGRRRD